MNNKNFFVIGIISSISFFTMEILGKILRPEYNPIKSYISQLFADGAPYAYLMKVFAYTSFVLLIIFAIGMTVISFKNHHQILGFGFLLLSSMAIFSTLGFGIFPMNIETLINAQNIAHTIITIIIMLATIIAMVLFPLGYYKQEGLRQLARISLITAIGFTIFNLMHFIAVFNHSQTLGLIERLGFYSLYIFIFAASWHSRKLFE